VLDENGNIYLSVNSWNMSVDTAGKIRWRWYHPVPIDPSPAVAANGEVYFSAPWRRLSAYQPNGAGLWDVDTTANLASSPTIGSDGTVYICAGQFLHAINSTNGLAPPAKSSWPMFHANARHTGRVQSMN
jgi:outer membrane protein assembly factor BamB